MVHQDALARISLRPVVRGTLRLERTFGIGRSDAHLRLHLLPFSIADNPGIWLFCENTTGHGLTTETFETSELRFRSMVDGITEGIVIYRSQLVFYANPLEWQSRMKQAQRLLERLSPSLSTAEAKLAYAELDESLAEA